MKIMPRNSGDKVAFVSFFIALCVWLLPPWLFFHLIHPVSEVGRIITICISFGMLIPTAFCGVIVTLLIFGIFE